MISLWKVTNTHGLKEKEKAYGTKGKLDIALATLDEIDIFPSPNSPMILHLNLTTP